MKRITSMLLALVMTVALAVPAFAAEGDTNSVTLVIQRQAAPGTAAPVEVASTTVSLDGLSGKELNVYQVVNRADIVTATNWKTVDVYNDDYSAVIGQGKALETLTWVNELDETTTWTNNGVSVPDATGEHGTYSGESWVYTVNGASPNDYMDWHAVKAGDTIALNFQYSSFSW